MTKAKAKSTVVAQFRWTAIKERVLEDGSKSYDMWEWNVWKQKWVRLSNTACGFGQPPHDLAQQRSREIQDMFDNNQRPPEPI
jgi:oligoribonuclease NrnB/cAMP/cGMP phosphodiesterase (DHH superfamily)